MSFVEKTLSIARKRLVTIAADSPLIDAARCLRESHTDLVIVCNRDARLAGVVTKSDVVRQISLCHGSACTTAASTVMTRTVTFCHVNDLLRDIWSTMKDRGLKNIPIVDMDSRPIGLLTARDVLETLLEEVEHEEQLLREYVMCVGYH